MGVMFIKPLVWWLVLQAITITGDSAVSRDVEFSVTIKNEMYGLKHPIVFYRCRAPNKDYGWHKSVPAAEFSWDFTVPPFGNGVKVHLCEFRSSEGTAEVEIETWSTTAMLCDGHSCTYVVRPYGIYFVGYELYNPSNILGRFFEMLRPVEKIIEPWKPWSPRQLHLLHRTRHRKYKEDKNSRDDDDDERVKDYEQEKDDDPSDKLNH